MKARTPSFCLIVILVFAVATETLGQPSKNADRKGAFGIKAGLIGGGTVNYDSKDPQGRKGDFETDGSYSFGCFFELPYGTRIRTQLCLDIHDMSVMDEGKSLLHLSAAFRYVIKTQDNRMAIRPGLSVGYGFLPDIDEFDVEPSHHLVMVASSEFILYTPKGSGFLMEVGLLWGVKGGNADWDAHGGPMLLIRGGLIL